MSNNNDKDDSKKPMSYTHNTAGLHEQTKIHFIKLREQMMNVCNLVEQNIQMNKDHASSVKQESVSQKEKDPLNEFPSQQTILNYKEKINVIKAKLEGFYNLTALEKLEHEIKIKKETVWNLSTENNALINIHKHQSKALNLYQEKYENKEEVDTLEAKLKSLKEEYKYTKELHKASEAKLKSQNAKINQLEEKCKIIKENIEYKKKQNMKEVLLTGNQIDNEDVLQLEEQLQFSEMQITTEEKNYTNEISRQQDTISRLNEEIDIIVIQHKEKEQEIRICELKLKELRKINLQSNELIKMKSQNAKEKEKKDIISKNKTYTNSKSNSKKRDDHAMSKTPNSYSTNNAVKNKPFQIKFQHGPLSEKNVNENKDSLKNKAYPSIHERDIQAEKDEMLIQIEALKHDIQRTLKSNDVKLFSPRQDGKSEENLTNDLMERMDQCSMIEKNEEEIDEVPVDNYKMKEINNIPQQYAIEEKRKPFGPFSFGKNE